MFYYLVSKLPIINSISDGKFFKIFLIGTICYINLHAYLFSKSASGSEFISKYRKYLYYIWGLDLTITGIMIKLFDNSNDNDDEIDSEEEKKIKEGIDKKLLELNSNSIFVKKDKSSDKPSDKP